MISKSPRLITACALIALLAACDTQPQTPSATQLSDTDQQTAFRLRQDFSAPLNADTGWAAGLNENATVFTDEPFRLRVEVQAAGNWPGTDTERRYQLQYQRNGGDWQAMPAENFPQPQKVFMPDLTADPGSTWQVLSGNPSALARNTDGDEPFLALTAGEQAAIALGRYETLWDAVEIGVDVRLAADETGGAGIIFGYTDAQNYHRVAISTAGHVIVDRYVDGEATRIAEATTDIVTGRWTELTIATNSREVTFEYGDGAFELTAEFDADIPASVIGLYVPAGTSADFANLVIEGEPRSPRISIMAADSFGHGEQTIDLLPASDTDFNGGSGVSFGNTTRPWTQASGHSEWEWPLVIRRFADGAETNETGDNYAFRMVTESGEPLVANAQPVVSVAVPPRHLGGVFVETPARIGPFEANNGDRYFLMEPAETDNMLMVVKSTDGGQSWQEVDGSNRPATGDLEGFAAVLANATLYMLHQTSDNVFLHAFRTSDHAGQPDTWAIQDAWLASPQEPPTQVADIAMRSDGSIVGVYGGAEKIYLKIRSPDGVWGDEIVVDADQPRRLSGPTLVSGHDDIVHLAYTGNDGSAWYRRLLPDGSLTPRRQVSTELGTRAEDVASILPLVFLPGSNSVSILYRVSAGTLWERRVNSAGELSDAVRVSDRTVVQNAVDSDQTGAHAIADGARVHLLFIDDKSRHLFHTFTDDAGNWQPATLLVDDINGQWVRGAQLNSDGQGRVYGYVYDAGADGGSGKNRYGEIPLADLP
ncbi:sialidase family protein [Pseudohongiella sp.]|uniref:Uncharacterized protein n=1 Tax=marine sediment metagenome TaxID=412755 RepID=A0A0F9YVS2_9ZZZZ|nr:sialidase family protein [Pseudohongiella sp.]HDZ08054.1 exo-alpha-sialidase [Pseudohongiella sp.]HEA64103.1 exo-alpha-sialidase [Pseudohongiella sp.]